jgi:hypothetical protein
VGLGFFGGGFLRGFEVVYDVFFVDSFGGIFDFRRFLFVVKQFEFLGVREIAAGLGGVFLVFLGSDFRSFWRIDQICAGQLLVVIFDDLGLLRAVPHRPDIRQLLLLTCFGLPVRPEDLSVGYPIGNFLTITFFAPT